MGRAVNNNFFCPTPLLVNKVLTYDVPMSTVIAQTRRALKEDAQKIAFVHDEAWNNAYSGMVPHKALSRMISRRGPNWWADAIARKTVILVLEIQDKIVGYATLGRNRVKTLPFDGEIYEIYLLPEYQGIGLGTKLFIAARGELERRGLKGTVVWALEDNLPALSFYKNAGGREIAEGKENFDGKELQKVAFSWN